MSEIIYNRRKYKIHRGIRGGYFIKVKGNKKYINLKNEIESMKKKISKENNIKLKIKGGSNKPVVSIAPSINNKQINLSPSFKMQFFNGKNLNSGLILVSINLNYVNPNNFMDIQVKFNEKSSKPVFIDLNLNNKLEIITSEEFMLKYNISPKWSFLQSKSQNMILTELLSQRAKEFLRDDSSKYIINTYTTPGALYFENIRYNFPLYKLHLSFNPNYLNEAFELFLRSDLFRTGNLDFKITLIEYKHLYDSSKWNDWITNHFVFIDGSGFFVIYLSRKNLNSLKEFIEYWKQNFENNPDKYRDANYIKFNVKLSETLYFGYGGDTSGKNTNKSNSKLNNVKNFLKPDPRRKSKSNTGLIEIFNRYLTDYASNKSKLSIVKKYLRDTYSIDYDSNQSNFGNGIADFYYWYDKDAPYLDLEKYGIYPYKWDEFQSALL